MKEGTKNIQRWQIDFDWLIELTKCQSTKDGQTKRIGKNPNEIRKKKKEKNENLKCLKNIQKIKHK